MKYALLKYSTFNIGDDIQSIAARNLYPKVDDYFDRDKISTYQIDEQAKILLNGWWSESPQHWPPSSRFIPLLISFHLTHKNNAVEIFLDEKNIHYLKEHQPIGCRDFWTLEKLQQKGVKSYFSGCLTLTLSKKNEEKSGKILLVDAFLNMPAGFSEYFIDKYIPDSLKDKIEIISHYDQNLSAKREIRIELAEQLLDRYSAADLVITSRLHCLLPCLAFDTPVYFMDYGYNTTLEKNRFGGLLELSDKISFKSSVWQKTVFRVFKIKKFYFHYLAKNILMQIKWSKSGNSQHQKVKKMQIELRKKVRKFFQK